MDFGMFAEFPVRPGMSQAEAFEESFRLVETAEQAGLDSVWLAEHHFRPEESVLASPLLVASAIAMRTSRIKIGLAVQILPLANPLRAAEEAATLDHISKGRFEYGIGRSGLTKYYQGYNVPYEESGERFFEALDVIMKAWSEERFSHAGRYYTFNDVTVVPKPLQKPFPLTRLAISSPETFPKVGAMGLPIFVSALTPIPELKDRLEGYREGRKQAGFTGPGDVMLRIPAFVAPTAEEARRVPEASTTGAVHRQATELIASAASEEIAERFRRNASIPYDDLIAQRLVYGTPESVVERLRRYRDDLGLSGVVLEMNYGGQIPYDQVVNSMRLTMERVVPELR